MTHDEMVAVAHRALLLGPSPLLRYLPGARRVEAEGVVLTSWGPFGPGVNKVVVVGPAPPLGRVLQLAEEFFGPASGGFGVVVEADAGHPIEAELRAAGWEVFEDEAALVLPSIGASPPKPDGLEIRRVADVETRGEVIRVLAEGFGEATAEQEVDLPPDALDALVPPLACAADPGVAMLVGYVDGRPASSAFLFVVGDIAGITGVATVPAYRRRGLATAMTWAALREAAARGCSCATLAAAGASYELYRKMGFLHVCNHRAYRRPGATAR